MKVSVIVPAYNVEDYLEKCLSSLVEQTLEELEILVVDDGSTDSSKEIIQKYAQRYPKRVRAFYKENGGQGSARNLALPQASGEYLGFVDGDDWVDPQMYETMYRKAREEDLDIVICDMMDHFPDHTLHHTFANAPDKFRQTPSACNKIFKKDLVADSLFLTGLWYEDFDFTTKLLFQTDRIGNVSSAFYHCHCRPASTMRNNNAPKNLDMLEVLDDIIASARKNGCEKKYEKELQNMVLEHVLITSINRVAQQQHPEKEEVIRKMREYVLARYPDFRNSDAFRELARNRRMIASLNARGLHRFSRFLLSVANRVK